LTSKPFRWLIEVSVRGVVVNRLGLVWLFTCLSQMKGSAEWLSIVSRATASHLSQLS
jgi:hypothetical protein